MKQFIDDFKIRLLNDKFKDYSEFLDKAWNNVSENIQNHPQGFLNELKVLKEEINVLITSNNLPNEQAKKLRGLYVKIFSDVILKTLHSDESSAYKANTIIEIFNIDSIHHYLPLFFKNKGFLLDDSRSSRAFYYNNNGWVFDKILGENKAKIKEYYENADDLTQMAMIRLFQYTNNNLQNEPKKKFGFSKMQIRDNITAVISNNNFSEALFYLDDSDVTKFRKSRDQKNLTLRVVYKIIHFMTKTLIQSLII
ncbi:MAG: hypothetical protein J0H68_04365 [Sphingobacteriia bacterium]|nr:hypothetical protein [Sphingobacteriia bacterium]